MSCGCGGAAPPWLSTPEPQIETNAFTAICNPATGEQIGWLFNLHDENADTDTPRFFDIAFEPMAAPASYVACTAIDYEFFEKCWRDVDDSRIEHTQLSVVINGDLQNAAVVWVLSDGTVSLTPPANIEPCPSVVPIQWIIREACDLDTGQRVSWKEGCDANGNTVYPNGAAAPLYYDCITPSGAGGNGCTVIERPGLTVAGDGSQGIAIFSDATSGYIKMEGLSAADISTMSAALSDGCILILEATGAAGEQATMVAGGPGWDGNLPGNAGGGGWFSQMDFSNFGTVCPDEVHALYAQFSPAPDDFGWQQISVTIHCLEAGPAATDGPLDPQPTNVGCCPEIDWGWREACDLDTDNTIYYIEGIDSNGNPLYPNGATAPLYYDCITSGGAGDNGCTVTERPGLTAAGDGSQGVAIISDGGLDYIKVEGFLAADISTMSAALNDDCILILEATGTAGEQATMVAGGPGWDGNLPGNAGGGGWFSQMDFSNFGTVCPDEVQALYAQFSPAPDDFGWQQISVTIHCLEAAPATTDGPLDPQPTNVGCCSDAVTAEMTIIFSSLAQIFTANSTPGAGAMGMTPSNMVSLTLFNMTETRVDIQMASNRFSVPPGGSHTVNVVRDAAGLVEEYLPQSIFGYQFIGNVGAGVGNDPPTLIVNFKAHQ